MAPLTDEKYLNYGQCQHVILLRTHYLSATLSIISCVSMMSENETWIWLLAMNEPLLYFWIKVFSESNQIFKRLLTIVVRCVTGWMVTPGPMSQVTGHINQTLHQSQHFNMITISLPVCWDIMGRGSKHKNSSDRELGPVITLITITQLALSPLYSVIHYTYNLNCWIWLSKNLYSTISFRANFIILS